MISLNNNKIPFFSVIICTFNRKNVLLRAINSLFNQKFEDWEAIIVDDGSDDGTFELIKELASADDRIRYNYHSNRGTGNSRNSGILASAGMFITFLDSDDEYHPTHLAIRRKVLIDNPGVDLLHGGVKIIGNKYVPDAYNPGKKIHLNECVIGGTFFFKKQLAIEMGGFSSKRFGDDTDFYQRVYSTGKFIGKIENKTYIYHRESPDSLCNVILNKNKK